ncbi:ADP-heptose:LPS heptosyltransferase [Motilibacter peucedani]|uniref:ADP-heptose:LPS heptosyltransferase n=1 Tax=Motilibacter peucedani TaxID=598650 RepID=A0A420XTQ8_9ACTN|nr:glycosyltransferase family 9 protein [Motilibacter peucedani]RKS80218.1 ADP-heptose:LPS heptosyltransferase [Motilibacter peucedani]
MSRVLLARLDSFGDVLLAGPAVRAVAASGARVTLLVSPTGAPAAELLPDVDEVVVWDCPWTGFTPSPVDAADVLGLVDRLRGLEIDAAVVLTSFHQSPLPLALLLRMAGVARIAGTSTDYPGSLLDLRHPPGGPHEVERNLSLVAAAGWPLPEGDDGRLALRTPLPEPPVALERGYVVLHPSASVPARSISAAQARDIAAALLRHHDVVLTGAASGRALADTVAAAAVGAEHRLVDLVGATSFAELAAVLERARCTVAVNTGPAHLSAAVGTPVVSLFAPVVAAEAWAPWGVPVAVLGDQGAECAASRARTCPVPGHPCLSGVAPDDVVAAVDSLLAVAA